MEIDRATRPVILPKHLRLKICFVSITQSLGALTCHELETSTTMIAYLQSAATRRQLVHGQHCVAEEEVIRFAYYLSFARGKDLKRSESPNEHSVDRRRASSTAVEAAFVAVIGEKSAQDIASMSGKTCLGVSKTVHIGIKAGGLQDGPGRCLGLLRFVDRCGRQDLVPTGGVGTTRDKRVRTH